ncbi:MAG: hypothetical protein DRH33_06570 [Candidatus Nealsonbacteria bacterium]|nr:MAG: hypothetical protein DRH33_06570 [Candidatus Nealsonbacteria bacterium]
MLSANKPKRRSKKIIIFLSYLSFFLKVWALLVSPVTFIQVIIFYFILHLLFCVDINLKFALSYKIPHLFLKNLTFVKIVTGRSIYEIPIFRK